MAVPARQERSTVAGGVERWRSGIGCKWFRGGEKKNVGGLLSPACRMRGKEWGKRLDRVSSAVS
jgi:hypothetical protein